MRAPVDHIAAPPFPRGLAWVNSPPQQLEAGRAMLVEFWDFCRPQSIRTLPYVKAWHERYPELKVIGVHAAGFPPSHDPDAVAAAVERLEIPYPVAIDARVRGVGAVRQPGLAGALPVRPARHAAPLPLRRGRLRGDRAGDPGAARNRASRCSTRSAPGGGARRAARAPVGRRRGALLGAVPTPARCGRCSRAPARSPPTAATVTVDHPGCYELIAHEHSTERRARARGRRRRHLPRRVLHARPQSSRLTSSGGRGVADDRRESRPVGTLAGRVADPRRVVHPAARVDEPSPLAPIVARQRAGAMGVPEDHMRAGRHAPDAPAPR